jgi:hypothetical protein
MKKSQKGLAQFLIPRGNTSELFEVVEEPFDLLASLVEGFIIAERCYPIAPGRYDRHHIMRDEVRSNGIAIIALVHNRMRQRLRRRHLRKHGLKGWTFMALASREDEGDTGTFITTAGMNFGRQTAPRAAQSLCGLSAVFFNAPAAC